MKRAFSMFTAASFALLFAASTAEAQRPVSFGVLAGASLPTGDTGDGFDTGFNLGLTAGFVPAMVPFGVRFDGMWHQLAEKGHDHNLRVLSGTANAQVHLPMTGMSPYLIGGIGMYNVNLEEHGDAQTEFGWNLGAGLRFQLAGFATFAEARFNRVSMDGGNLSIVPISFGIMF